MAQLPSAMSEVESQGPQSHEPEPDGEVGQSQSSHGFSRKRQRPDTVYPRKRGLMACQLCRGRKTKCDNMRPACSFCVSVGVACVYPDDKQAYLSFDSASVAIIERLDHVVGLLNTEFSRLHSQVDLSVSASLPSPFSSSNTCFSPLVPGVVGLGSTSSIVQKGQCQDSTWIDQSRITPSVKETVENDDFADITAAHVVTETILQWPIFSKLGETPETKSLVLRHDTRYVASDQESSFESESLRGDLDLQPRGRVHEEDFAHLCQSFLENVHCKNPILNIKNFTRSVREVSENGLRWDGQSCLVLLACALGAISSPFKLKGFDSEERITLQPENRSRITAASYFDAARKRLGLLLPSLLTIQCYFFSGVYEMYCIKPLNAWFSLHQASVQFKVYLSAVSYLNADSDAFTPDHRLEKRLYWSCMQSECELRVELRIPATGLEKLDFPNAFPSPPAGMTTEFSQEDHQGPGFAKSSSGESWDSGEVRSWMYYLAETSLRRVCSGVVSVLYQNGEGSWMRNIQALSDQARECASQLELWISHIPPQIHLDESIPNSSNELALHLRSRHIMCRTWIYRPFLYFMIHAPFSELTKLPAHVEVLAKKCLEYCTLSIFDTTYHHRHHGTWYTLRIAFSSALCILAAAKSGRVALPANWRAAIKRVSAILEIWEAESPNLKASRQILEGIYADI